MCYPNSSECIYSTSSSSRYRQTSYPRTGIIHWIVIFNQPVVVASICEQKYKVSRKNWGDIYFHDGLDISNTWTNHSTEHNYKKKVDKIFLNLLKGLEILTRPLRVKVLRFER